MNHLNFRTPWNVDCFERVTSPIRPISDWRRLLTADVSHRPIRRSEVRMQSLISDLQYSARELRKRPGFVLTAVLSLALGIGATSAVFSVIYAVLIDPFPYTGSDRIMEFRIQDKAGNNRGNGFNGPQIEQLRQANAIES